VRKIQPSQGDEGVENAARQLCDQVGIQKEVLQARQVSKDHVRQSRDYVAAQRELLEVRAARKLVFLESVESILLQREIIRGKEGSAEMRLSERSSTVIDMRSNRARSESSPLPSLTASKQPPSRTPVAAAARAEDPTAMSSSQCAVNGPSLISSRLPCQPVFSDWQEARAFVNRLRPTGTTGMPRLGFCSEPTLPRSPFDSQPAETQKVTIKNGKKPPVE